MGEPVAIEFANTVFAVRGRPTEGLESPRALADWLQDKGFAAGKVTVGDLDAARALRTAIRAIAAAATDGGQWDARAVATLNAHAAAPARWRELIVEPEPGVTQRSSGSAVQTALAVIADNAIEIFGGPMRHDLRGCPGPNCILYFLSDGRREWCSNTCGNRARAARHYAKTRHAASSRRTGR